MPDKDWSQQEGVAEACGCGPAMREMALACCVNPDGSKQRAGSEEQEGTTPDEGGA